MTPEQDPQLERAFRDYLAGELKGQLGRCSERFVEEMGANRLETGAGVAGGQRPAVGVVDVAGQRARPRWFGG